MEAYNFFLPLFVVSVIASLGLIVILGIVLRQKGYDFLLCLLFGVVMGIVGLSGQYCLSYKIVKTEAIQDYLRGKVKVEYTETYKDSELIKRDTLITFNKH